MFIYLFLIVLLCLLNILKNENCNEYNVYGMLMESNTYIQTYTHRYGQICWYPFTRNQKKKETQLCEIT